MASSLFLPEVVGSFLSGWNFLASSMYLLLICLSDTISSRLNPKIPSESLRFTPTPSGSNPLLFCGVGVSDCGYVVVGGGFSGGVGYYFSGGGVQR